MKRTTVGTHNEATRAAWLEKTLAAVPPGSRILDAGAGEQQWRRACAHLDYVSQDFGRYDGAGDGVGLQMGSWDQSRLDIISDITAIPRPDASFDAVLCVEVLEHLPRPDRAIAEFARLLRPGGRLILTAPFCSLTHFAPFHFYSGFNRYFYETQLGASGFEILEISPNGNFFEYLAQELRRVKEMAGRYPVDRPRPWERLALRAVLRMLERFSRRGGESNEILCFGYHVLARKRARD